MSILDLHPTAPAARTAVVRVHRRTRTLLPLPLLVGALVTSLCFGLRLALAPSRDYAWNDSYRYVMTIERILGDTGRQARAAALRWYCGSLGRGSLGRGNGSGGGTSGVAACVAHWTAAGGLAPNTAQYNQIFIARPGYPLLAAPLVAVFGLGQGLAIVCWLTAMAAGWLCLLIARAAGLRQTGALAAMIAFFLVPSFFWMQQYLTEGPTMVCTLVVLLGTVCALRGRARLGLTIAAAGYAAGFVVRYSTFSVQAGALAVCALLPLLFGRPARRGAHPHLVVAGFNAAAAVVMAALPPLLGWPGFSNSLQDTYTDHFTKPTPRGLYGIWLHHVGSYVIHIAHMYAHDPLVPLTVLVGLAVLWLRFRILAAVVSAAALTGVASALAHPVASQQSRLYYQVFLLAAFGMGALVDLIGRRLRARPSGFGKLPGTPRAPHGVKVM